MSVEVERVEPRAGERGEHTRRPRARACDPIPHITLRSTVDRALYTDVSDPHSQHAVKSLAEAAAPATGT